MSQQVTEPDPQESDEKIPTGETWDERPPAQEEVAEKAARRREAEEPQRREAAGDTVRLKVFRFDPDVPEKWDPYFDEFHVPFEQGMTVLDALIYARDHYDPSLTFRHSCRQAVCGSDAFYINGSQRLGCRTQIEGLDEPVRVEPLPYQDVLKDLVVDMQHFYDQMHSVDPFFDPDETPDGMAEQRQSPANREKIKMATRCIWCGACQSSCTIAASDEQYLGPASINKAYRFAMDEREGPNKEQERFEILEDTHGVWRCQTQFSCTTVCPKDIPLTEHIQEIKREAVKRNLKFW